MTQPSGRPSREVGPAPESGTVRDETSGNQPARPQQRGVSHDDPRDKNKPPHAKDDPCYAGEER